jgi:uncharacterized protein (UPF0332 family)/HAMP domain-containing protein
MKKIHFLTKLFKEKKLQFVDPSEEIKESYMEKSESNLISAKILLENDRLEESVSLTYYSMYHLVTALLFKVGIKCENHAASIILLKDLFSLDDKEILFAKKERVDKQYYTDFHITKEEVEEAVKTAEDFSKELLDFISKLTNEEANQYRLIALFVGVVGVVGISNLDNVEEVREYHELMSIPAVNILEKISTIFEIIHGTVMMADTNIIEAKKEYTLAKNSLFDLIEEYEKLALVKGKAGEYLAWKEMRDMMHTFSSQMHASAEKYDLISQEIFTHFQQEESGIDITEKLKVLNEERDTFKEILENDKRMELAGAKRENSRIKGATMRAKTTLLVLSILAIIFSIGLGLYVSQRITKPLEKLSKTVDEVSKGNFKVEIEKTSSIKEINTLADSLDRVMTTMKFAVEEKGPVKIAAKPKTKTVEEKPKKKFMDFFKVFKRKEKQ